MFTALISRRNPIARTKQKTDRNYECNKIIERKCHQTDSGLEEL